MANFEIDEDQAALIRELRKLETSDPVHANVYNALFEKLINNDAFLERLANKMIEKSMLCHVLDSVNAQQVLAADVGPKITAITNELKENVSVLNTKIGAKVAVVSFIKSSIPIAAGADFYAYIPIDIDTTDVIWAFPVLTDAPGDNCTKVNISTCVWQDASKQIYVNGCNLASGAANISLTGVLIAIR